MALIQIFRSHCKSASKYVITGAGLGVGVGFGSGEPGVAEPGLLEASIPSAIAPLSYAMAPLPRVVAPLGAESSSSSLGAAEPRGGFLHQEVILELSGVEKVLSFFQQTGYTVGCGALTIITKRLI